LPARHHRPRRGGAGGAHARRPVRPVPPALRGARAGPPRRRVHVQRQGAPPPLRARHPPHLLQREHVRILRPLPVRRHLPPALHPRPVLSRGRSSTSPPRRRREEALATQGRASYLSDLPSPAGALHVPHARAAPSLPTPSPMTERLPLRRAACLALLLGALAAPALRAQEAPPGRTCATPTPSEAVLQQHYEAVQAWVQQHPAPQGGETVTIPIAFHVVHNGTTGNIPDQWITDQVEVLNDAFADMGYRFVVAMLDRTENATWFSTCYGSGENPMKQALAIDPAHFLNIYTCLPSGGILGYAYRPDGDASSIHHGVVLHYNTLPGGGLFPYNQGDTGTHEVGHYVGLLHTFDGGCSGGDTPPGCETGGDRVCDTPAEASAAFGRPAGRDTCPPGGPHPNPDLRDHPGDACVNPCPAGPTGPPLAPISQVRPATMRRPDPLGAPRPLALGNVRLGESETKRVHVVTLPDAPLL